MSLINLNGISMSYGKKENTVHALSDINLDIEQGEFISIIGKSGCGKSTLLNVLGGITKPKSGTYLFDENNISKMSTGALAEFRNQNIGFVVQHFALIPDMNVYHNIALPLVYRKCSRRVIQSKVKEVCEQLEISDKMHCYPSELSGGQQQRVAIARAIVGNPSLLLADEPTGALDEETGENVFNILKSLNEGGMTIILVTHDLELAKQCKRQIHMKDGQL